MSDSSGAASVGVVVCACAVERWEQLTDALRSIQDQRGGHAEIVLVIDHNDALLARARQAFPALRVLANTGPRGLSAARNAGTRALNSDVVAFIDDDARAEPDWLHCIQDAFRSPEVVGVGGWVEPEWEASVPVWLAPELYWVVGCSYVGLPGEAANIRNPIGANMAFRRAALLEVGGFGEDVGQTLGSDLRDDETDLAIRVRACRPHQSILHLPSARVRHHVPSTRARWSYLISRCWSEGRGKAVLVRTLGAAALSSERRYSTRVLPAAAARGVRDGLLGRPDGLARAASILLALPVTVAGYLFGLVTIYRSRRRR